MRIGYMKQTGAREFTTLNGRVKIKLERHKSGHIHVKVSGAKRFTALTSIHADLTRLELLAVANFVFSKIGDGTDYILKLRHSNYAEVFGSVWIGGVS